MFISISTVNSSGVRLSLLCFETDDATREVIAVVVCYFFVSSQNLLGSLGSSFENLKLVRLKIIRKFKILSKFFFRMST